MTYRPSSRSSRPSSRSSRSSANSSRSSSVSSSKSTCDDIPESNDSVLKRARRLTGDSVRKTASFITRPTQEALEKMRKEYTYASPEGPPEKWEYHYTDDVDLPPMSRKKVVAKEFGWLRRAYKYCDEVSKRVELWVMLSPDGGYLMPNWPQRLAVKKINKASAAPREVQLIVKNGLFAIPHLCNYLGWEFSRQGSSSIYGRLDRIYFPYAEHGDLPKFRRQRLGNEENFDERMIWIFFIQLAFAVKQLHDRNIVHHAISPEHIIAAKPRSTTCACRVCRGHGDVYFTLIGLSGARDQCFTLDEYYSQRGNKLYQPPERDRRRQGYICGYAADMWAVGALIHEMVHGCPPVDMRERHMEHPRIVVTPANLDSADEVRASNPSIFSENPFKSNRHVRYSDELNNIMMWLLSENPDDRVLATTTFSQAKLHWEATYPDCSYFDQLRSPWEGGQWEKP